MTQLDCSEHERAACVYSIMYNITYFALAISRNAGCSWLTSGHVLSCVLFTFANCFAHMSFIFVKELLIHRIVH